MRRVPTSLDTILGSQIPDRARLRRRGLFELKKTVLKLINLIVLRNSRFLSVANLPHFLGKLSRQFFGR